MKYLHDDFSFRDEVKVFVFSDRDKKLHVFAGAKEAVKAFYSSERAERWPIWMIKPTAPEYNWNNPNKTGMSTCHMMEHVRSLPDEMKNKYAQFCFNRAERIYTSVNGNERLYNEILCQLVSGFYGAD